MPSSRGAERIGSRGTVGSNLVPSSGESVSPPNPLTTSVGVVWVLAGVSPVYYTVVCESQHGIFAHTTDQTVT